MSILEHIDELRSSFIKIVISIGFFTILSFTFGIKEFVIEGTKVLLPFPDPFDNIASQAIQMFEKDLLPKTVSVIVTEPSQAIVAQFYFAIFLGIIFSMPIIIRELNSFFGPALYAEERKRILKLAIPGTFLFILGALFSYYVITPYTIDFLYQYSINIVHPICFIINVSFWTLI